MEIPDIFGDKHVPIPDLLVRGGFSKEIMAYAVLLNEDLGLPADMLITEKMMLEVIQAHLIGGKRRAAVRLEIGRARFEGIVRKYKERVRAHEIMFGIKPEQIRGVVLKMNP